MNSASCDFRVPLMLYVLKTFTLLHTSSTFYAYFQVSLILFVILYTCLISQIAQQCIVLALRRTAFSAAASQRVRSTSRSPARVRRRAAAQCTTARCRQPTHRLFHRAAARAPHENPSELFAHSPSCALAPRSCLKLILMYFIFIHNIRRFHADIRYRQFIKNYLLCIMCNISLIYSYM